MDHLSRFLVETFQPAQKTAAQEMPFAEPSFLEKRAYALAAADCGADTGFLKQFEGTPLAAQAVALAEQELAMEQQALQRRMQRAATAQQDNWEQDMVQQDGMRLQKQQLLLQLYKMKAMTPAQQPGDAVIGQPQPGAAPAEAQLGAEIGGGVEGGGPVAEQGPKLAYLVPSLAGLSAAGGAVLGGVTGLASSDTDHRTRGMLRGAGLGAVAGGLGGAAVGHGVNTLGGGAANMNRVIREGFSGHVSPEAIRGIREPMMNATDSTIGHAMGLITTGSILGTTGAIGGGILGRGQEPKVAAYARAMRKQAALVHVPAVPSGSSAGRIGGAVGGVALAGAGAYGIHKLMQAHKKNTADAVAQGVQQAKQAAPEETGYIPQEMAWHEKFRPLAGIMGGAAAGGLTGGALAGSTFGRKSPVLAGVAGGLGAVGGAIGGGMLAQRSLPESAKINQAHMIRKSLHEGLAGIQAEMAAHPENAEKYQTDHDSYVAGISKMDAHIADRERAYMASKQAASIDDVMKRMKGLNVDDEMHNDVQELGGHPGLPHEARHAILEKYLQHRATAPLMSPEDALQEERGVRAVSGGAAGIFGGLPLGALAGGAVGHLTRGMGGSAGGGAVVGAGVGVLGGGVLGGVLGHRSAKPEHAAANIAAAKAHQEMYQPLLKDEVMKERLLGQLQAQHYQNALDAQEERNIRGDYDKYSAAVRKYAAKMKKATYSPTGFTPKMITENLPDMSNFKSLLHKVDLKKSLAEARARAAGTAGMALQAAR